jgi:CBS domain-containing protein
MRRKRVAEILLPYREDVPADPYVDERDTISRAVELMVNNNVRCMAVMKDQKPVGIVCLEDALEKLGLRAGQVSP